MLDITCAHDFKVNHLYQNVEIKARRNPASIIGVSWNNDSTEVALSIQIYLVDLVC